MVLAPAEPSPRTPASEPPQFFATAAKGTERALRDELRELRFSSVRADRGGVHFGGALREGYRACLWSRIAMRVLMRLATFDAPNERALYDGVRAVDLESVLTPRHTLAVGAACRSSRLTHTEYLSQLTKDAIVDRLRDRHGSRPNVDKRDPDVRLFVHLANDVATLYLDLAGEPLNRRGFRPGGAEAPLKETLAAAVLRYSGWDRRSALLDPFCGSGTLLIEAGLWAENRAPGLSRERFGFERWARFDAAEREAFERQRAEARAALVRELPPLIGRDTSEEALALARSAAKRASLPLTLEVGRARDATLSEAGAVVANPPYGKRLGRPAELARDLAFLVDRHPNAHVSFLLAEAQPMGRTRRRPEPPRHVFNGDLPCVVRSWAPRRSEARG
ncbi:MAG TPA: THUMP domain-containing protein [Polyangiaceae bacterium]|nr:THUMP domain-containing protein [Polyangiaceae bacterium]